MPLVGPAPGPAGEPLAPLPILPTPPVVGFESGPGGATLPVVSEMQLPFWLVPQPARAARLLS